MQTTNSFFLEAATVAVYILLLWLPGGVAGAAAGLRGWVLAASAPLITRFMTNCCNWLVSPAISASGSFNSSRSWTLLGIDVRIRLLISRTSIERSCTGWSTR